MFHISADWECLSCEELGTKWGMESAQKRTKQHETSMISLESSRLQQLQKSYMNFKPWKIITLTPEDFVEYSIATCTNNVSFFYFCKTAFTWKSVLLYCAQNFILRPSICRSKNARDCPKQYAQLLPWVTITDETFSQNDSSRNPSRSGERFQRMIYFEWLDRDGEFSARD